MASEKRKSTLVFIDLDDTLFQTRRKNQLASIPATTSPNPDTVSYMSVEQKELLDTFLNNDNCAIIPVTARDFEQYHRTMISQDVRIQSASIYYGAQIFQNREVDKEWDSIVQQAMVQAGLNIDTLHADIASRIDPTVFTLFNVSGYYLAIKNKDRSNYASANQECYQMLQEVLPASMQLHINDNNIAIVPDCIDKKHAVQYLIARHQPALTIGMGDSLSDWNFMDLCHFKIVPQQSQLNKNLAKLFSPYAAH